MVDFRIETVTQKPVTRKPMVFDQPEAGGLERGASSEPLSTRRNKGNYVIIKWNTIRILF